MQNTNPPQHTNPTTYRTPSNSAAFDFDDGTPLPQLNLASLASARKARGASSGPAKTPSSSGLKMGSAGGRRGVEVDDIGSSPWDGRRIGRGEENLEVEMDMARMQLISPPPEEVLRRVSSSRHAAPLPTTPGPFTSSLFTKAPSYPSVSASTSTAQHHDDTSPGSSKRKRSAHVTPKPTRVLPAQSSSRREDGNGDIGGESGEAGVAQWAQATPNPRLRKQVRRGPLDDEGEGGIQDVEMASPTKAKGKAARLPPATNLTASNVKGKGRRTRESPAYEAPPEMYMIPIRHTTMSPPVESGRGARAKGKGKERESVVRRGRESVREEMEDEEDGDPLLLSSSGGLEDGDEWGRPVEPPGWIVRTPKRDTPKRRAGSSKSTAKSSKKKIVRTPGKTPGSTVKRRVTVELGSTSVREAVDVVLLEEGVDGDEDGDEQNELGQILEKQRSVGGKPSVRRGVKATPVGAVKGRNGDVNRKGGPLDFDLPPSSPPPEQSSEGNFDWTRQPGVDVGGHEGSEEDSMMHPDLGDALVAPVHLPDLSSLNAAAAKRGVGARLEGEGDGWSSDEDSGDDLGGFGQVEGTGEYTGRWRVMRVKTKEDPPSEATMERMEEWGRPVSPYPGVRRLSVGGTEVLDLLSTPPRAESPPLRGAGEEGEPSSPPVAELRPEQEEHQGEERTPRRRNTLDVQRLWEDAHLSPPQEQNPPQNFLRIGQESQQHLPPDPVADTLSPEPRHHRHSTETRHDHQLSVPQPNSYELQQEPSSDPGQEDEEEEEVVRISLEPEDDAPQGSLLTTPKPVCPSPTESLKGGKGDGLSPTQRRGNPSQHQEDRSSPIRPSRQQEARRPTFPETPKGAFAFDASSSPARGYDGDGSSSPVRDRYEEEYLVQTKAGDDYTEEEEWEEDQDEEMEEDEVDEDEDGESGAEVGDVDGDYVREEDEGDTEEEMDPEEAIDHEVGDEQEEEAKQPVLTETPVREPRGAFDFQELTSPVPDLSPVRVQASQGRRRVSRDAPTQVHRLSSQEPTVQGTRQSTRQTPLHVAEPACKLDVVSPSSSPLRGEEWHNEASSSPVRGQQASSSPERLEARGARRQPLPETPAPRHVLVEENKVEQVQQADDDDDELDEAIVEELATPKNARELPYYDHYTPIHKAPFEAYEHVAVARGAASDEGGDAGEDSESDLEPGMVKIISADPRAAARAAAILKQYDYECYTKLAMKQLKTNEKKHRYSSIDGLSQSSIRRSLLGSGVSKSASRETAERERRRRRSSLGMGVIGDTVVIPGSPSVTLPQLLEQVEEEVRRETPSMKRNTLAEREAEQEEDVDMEPSGRLDERRLRNPLVDPVMTRSAFKTPAALRAWNPPSGPGKWQGTPWTKEEWKLLDSCLTDERLGGLASPSTTDMKSVDAVDVESVIVRFVGMLGGEEMLARCGEGWSRDILRQRIRALQQKQRMGRVAPPSTPLASPSAPANTSLPLGGEKRLPSMEVPDFTPLGRRAKPPRRSRPPTAKPSARADDGPFNRSALTTDRKKGISANLLAPRYSHLLDEARAINAEVSDMSMQQDSNTENRASDTNVDGHCESVLPQAPMSVTEAPKIPQDNPSSLKTPGASLRKRLSGIFFSYMPTLTARTAPPSRRVPREAQPGLPLPPLEVLQRSRTVKTPTKAPRPRPVPLKELVELHPAPQPKPSMIPRLNRGQQPKRLVSLNHIPPLSALGSGITSTGSAGDGVHPRRGSGTSVKDLVRGFEQLGAKAEEDGRRSRPNSALSVRSDRGMIVAPGTLMGLSKPGWKP